MRFSALCAALFAAASLTPASATDAVPDPKVLEFKLPAQIPWGPVTPGGSQVALLYGDPAKLTVTQISATGEAKTLSHDGPLPWTFQSGNRSFTLLHDYSHALEVSHFVQSSESGDQRPAIVGRLQADERISTVRAILAGELSNGANDFALMRLWL